MFNSSIPYRCGECWVVNFDRVSFETWDPQGIWSEWWLKLTEPMRDSLSNSRNMIFYIKPEQRWSMLCCQSDCDTRCLHSATLAACRKSEIILGKLEASLPCKAEMDWTCHQLTTGAPQRLPIIAITSFFGNTSASIVLWYYSSIVLYFIMALNICI